MLEKSEKITENHELEKFLIYTLNTSDHPLKLISDYEEHTGMEISINNIEKVTRDNNLSSNLMVEPINKDAIHLEKILSNLEKKDKNQDIDLNKTEIILDKENVDFKKESIKIERIEKAKNEKINKNRIELSLLEIPEDLFDKDERKYQCKDVKLVKKTLNDYKYEIGLEPNRGTRITNKFFEWLENKIEITKTQVVNKQIMENNVGELIKIKEFCEIINKNQVIEKYIINKIHHTGFSQVEIVESLKEMGINSTRKKIVEIAKNKVFKNNQEGYSERFPHGGQSKVNIESLKGKTFTEEDWKNLRSPELKAMLDQYRRENKQESNRGTKIIPNFFNWLDKKIEEIDQKKVSANIKKNEKKRLEELKKNCEIINKNQEIIKFIVDKTIHTNDSQHDIVKGVKKLGFYFDKTLVKKYTKEILFPEDERGYKERFPEYRQENTDFEMLRGKNFKTNDWPNLRTPGLKKLFNEYRYKTNHESNMGMRITKGFMNWLDKKIGEIGSKDISKQEKIKIKNELKDLKRSCLSINEHSEIGKFIVDKITHSDKSLREIDKELQEMGYNSSYRLIKRYAKEIVYYNDKKRYKNRFPAREEVPENIRLDIIYDIINTNLSTGNLALKYKVAPGTISNISFSEVKKYNPSYDHNERFPYNEPLTENVRMNLINDILNSKLTAQDIALKYEISPTTVLKISNDDVKKYDPSHDHQLRFPRELPNEIGHKVHKCINNLLTKHFKDAYGMIYISDPQIYTNSQMKPDGLICNDAKFLKKRLTDGEDGKNLLNELFGKNYKNSSDLKDLEKFKAILFDYTSDLSNNNIIEKSIKYVSADMLFMIVGTQWYFLDKTKKLPQNHPDYKNVKYPNNIKVISHNVFADFIGLKDVGRQKFEAIINASYNQDLDSLKKLNSNYSLEKYGTKDLKLHLIQKKLIMEDLSEYFSDLERNKNEENDQKQKSLDKYI